MLQCKQRKTGNYKCKNYIDILIQDNSNSSMLTLELLQSCAKPVARG